MPKAGRNEKWRIGASLLHAFGCTVLLASCSSDAAARIDPVEALPVFTLVSPQLIRVTDGLRPVLDTIVIDLRSANGDPRRNEKVYASGTTGWLRALPSGGWGRPSVMNTDSIGRLRLLWLPGASGPQTLAFSSMGPVSIARSFSLRRTGIPFRADSVVPSGREAICFQQGGRIGCVGVGACGNCDGSMAPSLAVDAVHWFRLEAPPRTLTSTLSGACALMIDGNTTCWDGLGPDSIARNDVGHPPFVEFTGSIGRTADGAVWKGVISGSTGYAQVLQYRTWNRIPSDSAMTALLTDFDETFLCARTASRAVMCSVADRGLLEPSVIMQPFRLLRTLPDSSVVRAVTGYTAVFYEPEAVVASAVVRTVAGAALRFVRPVPSSTGWYASPTSDSTLAGDDPRTWACVSVLDARCDGTAPWRQVSLSGRMTSRGYRNSETGFRRTCGVRDVIVCHLLITSSAGQGYFAQRFEIVDTIRLAP